MSYEIIKSISIKNEKVFLTAANSSLNPLQFEKFEAKFLSEMFQNQGREVLFSWIGKEIVLEISI